MTEIEICSVKEELLCKVTIETNWTVRHVKNAIAKKIPDLPTCKQSLRLSPTRKGMSDNLLLSSISLRRGNKLYVKDMGAQVSWTLVFLAEYFGPLIIYAIFAMQPVWIYGSFYGGMAKTAQAAWSCWTLHYSKRLFETIFVHRFSHETMPLFNIFKNCGYYWGFAAYIAYHINHPLYTPPTENQYLLGLIIFMFCEIGNLSSHVLLRGLRAKGGTGRKIPYPNANPFTWLFNFVSCANYTYEFGAWIGFAVMVSCLPAALFAAVGMYQMTLWALGKHRNYHAEFMHYPCKRKAIIPFLL